MEKMIVSLVIIGIAAILMLIKWPASALGYSYCVAVGVLMAGKFLYPFTSDTYEVLHCMTLGGGIGALFGLFFALAIHQDIGISGILGCAIVLPILMFIMGFIVILSLGLLGMFQQGHGTMVVTSGFVMWGLICAIVGGGGSILVIIFKR